MKKFATFLLLWIVSLPLMAQFEENQYNQMDPSGNISRRNTDRSDSLSSEKEIPKGIKVWTIDRRFGDMTYTTPDTVSYMFMNRVFTSGMKESIIRRAILGRHESTGFSLTARSMIPSYSPSPMTISSFP